MTDGITAFEAAVNAAKQSPCAKSKRGVAIWRVGSMVGVGFNRPPPGMACDGSMSCIDACSKLCLHAERVALNEAGKCAQGSSLVHVEVIGEEPVVSGPPSCWQCSRDILDARIKSVWLLQTRGLVEYTALNFHIETLRNCGLPVIEERCSQ
jgi:deoxycytidylate deaminase